MNNIGTMWISLLTTNNKKALISEFKKSYKN